MSFDLSGLPTKTEFEAANPAPVVSTPTPQEEYDTNKERIKNRIMRFFSRVGDAGNNELKIRVGFLTTEDKNALASSVEGKGYSCSENAGLMTIN